MEKMIKRMDWLFCYHPQRIRGMTKNVAEPNILSNPASRYMFEIVRFYKEPLVYAQPVPFYFKKQFRKAENIRLCLNMIEGCFDMI